AFVRPVGRRSDPLGCGEIELRSARSVADQRRSRQLLHKLSRRQFTRTTGFGSSEADFNYLLSATSQLRNRLHVLAEAHTHTGSGATFFR
ncbi:unnamed protein product, partial [Ectocarpus fasciculatus]